MELLHEFAECLEEEAPNSCHQARKRQHYEEDSAPWVEPATEGEEEALIQEVCAELEGAWVLWESVHEERQDFLTRILGGAWTKKQKTRCL